MLLPPQQQGAGQGLGAGKGRMKVAPLKVPASTPSEEPELPQRLISIGKGKADSTKPPSTIITFQAVAKGVAACPCHDTITRKVLGPELEVRYNAAWARYVGAPSVVDPRRNLVSVRHRMPTPRPLATSPHSPILQVPLNPCVPVDDYAVHCGQHGGPEGYRF